ncbi:tellurite resistance TerB family protein [Kordiimonas pumila]|uniref:TerB family tellurite resistance protein n=1 Tax=Kordiimonas pumila TaxID=2161677 RepID=A0ABV7CZV6_9PROT|nr:TerB family tellurite resistance protein [Kordiimonas pumila]
MLRRVSQLLGFAEKEAGAPNDLALATAALLVQVSVADGDFSAEEHSRLEECLMAHFHLDATTVAGLVERAARDQADATCLYAFTRTIAHELDQQGRQDIVRLLWQVALVDDSLDNVEANVIAKIAGLLGVSTADRVRLRDEVKTSSTIA